MLGTDIAQSLVNGAAVFVGLMLLWTFVGAFRMTPGVRWRAASVAAVFAAITTFVIRVVW